jgi:hypothetical protein
MQPQVGILPGQQQIHPVARHGQVQVLAMM